MIPLRWSFSIGIGKLLYIVLAEGEAAKLGRRDKARTLNVVVIYTLTIRIFFNLWLFSFYTMV
jgi:hypothetical protein